MNIPSTRVILAAAGLALIGFPGVVYLRSGDNHTHDTPPDGTEASTPDNALQFPPPTAHGHTYMVGTEECPTEVEESYDEFSGTTETSVEIHDFAEKFFSLTVSAKREGERPKDPPKDVELVFACKSPFGPPFKDVNEMFLLLDGRRLFLSGLDRKDSTAPSTEYLIEQANQLRRMNQYLGVMKEEGKLLEQGKRPPGGLTRVDKREFEVHVAYDTDYWVRLSKRLPISDFLQFVNATSVRGRLGNVAFTVAEDELNVLRDYASRLAPTH